MIMSTDLITVGEFDPLTRVKEIFDNNNLHHIPVVESCKIIGIISKSDYLFFLRGFSPDEAKYDIYRLKAHFVHEIMTVGVATLEVQERVVVALEVFKENLFHAIPITNNERLVGIVTTYDIINALAENKGAINQYQIAS
jgi:acetoin utilization protein AcuB